ncbi:11113_t:CDS:2, partial [Rhizophagus irregularis]
MVTASTNRVNILLDTCSSDDTYSSCHICWLMTRRSILIAVSLMTLLALCGQKHKSGNCIDKLWIKIENKYKERERTDVMCSDTGIQLANCNGVRICNFSSSGKRIYENGEGVVTQQKRTKLKSVNVSDQVDDLTDECMSTPVDDLSDSTTTSTTKNKPKYIQHDFRTKLKSANVSDQVDDLTDECMSTPVDDLV